MYLQHSESETFSIAALYRWTYAKRTHAIVKAASGAATVCGLVLVEECEYIDAKSGKSEPWG